MKVRIVVTVDVDPDAVRAEYGEVKQTMPDREVRNYVIDDVKNSTDPEFGQTWRAFRQAIRSVEVK